MQKLLSRDGIRFPFADFCFEYYANVDITVKTSYHVVELETFLFPDNVLPDNGCSVLIYRTEIIKKM